MREAPPPELVRELERLGLAAPREVARMSGRVRRLARDLPRFESVWIDALQQAGVLSPYQASELHAGRGNGLRIGPGVLRRRIAAHGYAHSYEARAIEPRRPLRVSIVAPSDCTGGAGDASHLVRTELALAELVRRLASREIPGVVAIEAAGIDHASRRIWTASRWVPGTLLHDRLLRHGRFPPEIVLEIARQMVAALAGLSDIGVVHGDLSATRALVTRSGEVVLTEPGLRGIVRPEEGYANASVAAEACDYLSPERIADGAPIGIASDLFACGLLWRRLLTGRAPLGGGASLCRMRAAHQARFPDLARLTIDVPRELTTAIAACLAAAPGDRPAGFAALAAQLGPSTPESQRALARFAADRRGRPLARLTTSHRSASETKLSARQLAVSAAAVLALLAATRPWWPAFTDGLTSATAAAHARVDPPRPALPVSSEAPPRPAPSASGGAGPLQRLATAEPPRLIRPASNKMASNKTAPTKTASTQPPTVDVAPASPAERTSPAFSIAANGDLVLPADEPLELDQLPLKAGQTVRGPSGGARPTVLVPQAGLWVEAERVTFVGVDFVWTGAADRHLARVRPSALIRLGAEVCTFQGCTFAGIRSGEADADASPLSELLPAAIRWTGPEKARGAAALPTGQLRLEQCVFRDVAAGVGCQFPGAVVLDLHGSLILGPGPAIRLTRWPRVDEPLAIAISKTTLRGASSVLECPNTPATTEGTPGSVTIAATSVALAPAGEGAVILFTGTLSPARQLAAFEWTGEDSLVIPGVPLAAWRDPEGELRPAREEQVSASGLVRGQIGFAGEAAANAAASRITRWTGPRRSPDPPGAGDGPLPWPKP